MKPIYIVSSNLISQRARMDMIADNIANANTAGFKHQTIDFEEVVSRKSNQTVASFTNNMGTRTNFENGSFTKTNNPLDTAIQGAGFFAVERDGKVMYTRNGSFTIDSEGNLATHDGAYVLDSNGGTINIPPTSTQITITADGAIADENGVISNLGIFEFQNPQNLLRAGSNGWIDPAGNSAIISENPRLAQGFIENANVNAIEETVNMTEMLRAYQSATKLVSDIEGLEKKVIRDLSRLP